MDSVSKQKRSDIMRLVKSNESSLERKLRKWLWRQGIRYRKNNSSLYGKPDISNISKKIVIFIDSCYWHGCQDHLRMPKTNIDYWILKIEKNKKRDKSVSMYYTNKQWRILRFWEHRINVDFELVGKEIKEAMLSKSA